MGDNGDKLAMVGPSQKRSEQDRPYAKIRLDISFLPLEK